MKQEKAKMEGTVKLKLPLSRNEKEDVFVGVNGDTWMIQRGQEVEVPWYVARVLERQEKMLDQAMKFEEAVARRAEQMDKKEQA